MYEHLLYEVNDKVAVVTINNPKSLNALNSATLDELNDCFKAIEKDDSLRVVIVTGSGAKSFVAGADISEMVNATAEEGRAMALLADETFGRLEKMNKVISREYPEAARETLLVLDATTGKNAVSQAQEFGNLADITGIVLTKLDGTAKGGIAITIADEFDMPIKFIGCGEQIDDLVVFDPKEYIGGIFSE